METLELLQNTWFILVGVLLVGYSILDGFDLGIGVLFPWLAKKDKEKQALFNAIAPFWDGNEVWLLAGAGALFAAFPPAYAAVFSGFYLAMMLVLFALIVRAAAIEFFFHDEQRRALWQWCFMIGSFLPALLFGVALGNVIVGVPLDNDMNFSGDFFTLLRPFPLVTGLLGLNAILLQGVTYAAARTDGEIAARARKITRKLWVSFIILFILSFIMAVVYLPGAARKTPAWIGAAVVLAAWLLLKRFMNRGRDLAAFSMSSLSFIGLWGIAAGLHFPNLVRAGSDITLSITIHNASSGLLTLKIMSIIAAVGMPFVLFYTYYIYKTFRGKIKIK